MSFSGACAIWAIKNGDFTPTNYAGDNAGLQNAINYAATSNNGRVDVYNGGSGLTIPTIPAGVRVVFHEGGREKHYGPGGRIDRALNVRDFGAVGDGIADDTAAINAAYSALDTNGGEIYFPYGSYLVSSTITLAKPVNITGAGVRVDGSRNHNSRILKKGTMSSPAFIVSGSGSSIKDLGFVGLSGNTGYMIHVKANYFRLVNVLINDNGSSAVDGDRALVIGDTGTPGPNCNLFTLDHVTVNDCASDGIYIYSDDGGGGPNANGGQMLRVSVSGCGRKGIVLAKAGLNTLVSCHAEGNQSHGLYITGNSDNNIVIGGDFEGNNAPGTPGVQVCFNGNDVAPINSCNDNVFIPAGLQNGLSGGFQDIQGASQNNRTLLIGPGMLRHNRGATGEILSNGPEGGSETSPGVYMSVYSSNGPAERIRVGVCGTTPPDVTPAQLMWCTGDTTTVLRSRSNTNNAKLLLEAGDTANRVQLAVNPASVGDSVSANRNFVTTGTGAYNQPHLVIGTYHLWVEAATGKLRIKNGAPGADNEGTVVGAQT